MKTTINKFLTVIALVSITLCISCSSNNDDVPSEELSEVVMKDFVQNIGSLSIPSGIANSNNSYAQEANAQFQSVKTLATTFAGLFTVPDNATSAKSPVKTAAKSSVLNTKTYTWSANGISVTYILSEQSDRYTFEYSMVSPSFTGKYMDGYQLKDGSYAEMNLYTDQTVVSTIKWWVNDNSMKFEMDTFGYQVVLEANADNSGTMKVYEDTFLAGLYEWNANGSGSYIDYYTSTTYTW